MISGTQNRTKGSKTPGRGIASVWACIAAVCLLVLSAPGAQAGPRGWRMQRVQARRAGGMRAAPARQPARPAEAPRGNNAGRPAGNPPAEMRPGVNGNAGMYGAERPGHLGQWLSNHQNLTLPQQEEELRREPGFNRLRPEEQQRVLNRLRTLEARPPAQQQRMIGRVELFERLTPQQKADVRASSQALAGMAPDRKRMVGTAFNDLRHVPPDQRAAILNSARFQQTFSPQERQVLGNLLSIEPYAPR
ncbi:MAG TPA: DUF3106 domain-containing protein [Acidobacteriaceae bacterium]|nr:DUF3106 domain-containing protein [Acidobacteriaceae bacterium]